MIKMGLIKIKHIVLLFIVLIIITLSVTGTPRRDSLGALCGVNCKNNTSPSNTLRCGVYPALTGGDTERPVSEGIGTPNTSLDLTGKVVSSSQIDLNWILIPSDNKPSPRFGHAMAYDSARNKIVLFGGYELNNETWERDGTQWILKSPTHKPLPRYYHSMVYDSARGKVVLFGGMSESSIDSDELISSNETWEWDGTDWTLRTPVHKPSGRRASAMAYDSERGKTVLFGGEIDSGGFSDETWEWDGTDWTLRTPVHKPSAQWGSAMVYDSKRHKIMFYRGFGWSNELWSWDGIDWTLIKSPANSSDKSSQAMAYDSVRDRLVVMVHDETWEYNGTDWSLKSPENKPMPVWGHFLAYDTVRHRTVLFGGVAGCYPNDETWEWGY